MQSDHYTAGLTFGNFVNVCKVNIFQQRYLRNIYRTFYFSSYLNCDNVAPTPGVIWTPKEMDAVFSSNDLNNFSNFLITKNCTTFHRCKTAKNRTKWKTRLTWVSPRTTTPQPPVTPCNTLHRPPSEHSRLTFYGGEDRFYLAPLKLVI